VNLVVAFSGDGDGKFANTKERNYPYCKNISPVTALPISHVIYIKD
jgi:hypothetical protein